MFFFSFRRIQTKREQSNIIISFIISHFISRSIYFLFHSCILKSALGIQYHLTQGTVLVWSFYSVSLTRWYCLREGIANIAKVRSLLRYRHSVSPAPGCYCLITGYENRSIQLYHCIVGTYYNLGPIHPHLKVIDRYSCITV